MTTTINASTSAGLVQTADTSGILQLQTASTAAVTIDTSQNVGIGTTSPTRLLDVTTTGALAAIAVIQNTSTASAQLRVKNPQNETLLGVDTAAGGLTGTGSATYLYGGSAYPTIFYTNATERMRIDSSGNVTMPTNAVSLQVGNSASQANIGAPSNTSGFQINGSTRATNPYILYAFANANGVYLAKDGTSWTSNSDERLKDIIEPISNATTKVSSLRAVIGKYKTDAEGTRRSFLIAQDVQAVLPEAVNSHTLKDDVSGTEYLGVNYTDVIPLLVASIKELKQINDTQAETINALTARIVALEK